MASFPGESFARPFLAQLYAALEEQDVIVCREARFRLGWLWRRRREIDIIHLHEPRSHYRSGRVARGPFGFLVTVCLTLRFVCLVGLARRLGMRVVWSVHSLLSDEARHRRLDRLAERRLVAGCDRLIAHCARSKRQVLAAFRIAPRRVAVIPLGHFAPAYEDCPGRAEARDRLGVGPDSFVYLHYCGMGAYRGIPSLLRAFGALGDGDARLWLVGSPGEPDVAGAARDAARESPERVVLRLEHVPDAELKLCFSACDVSVLPYVPVLSPWGVVLSLSFGVPVVAPALGCIPEIVGPREGVTYDPDRPTGLVEALRQARTAPFAPRERIRERTMEAHRWDRVAALTREVYTESMGAV